jgi:hypothetical protein
MRTTPLISVCLLSIAISTGCTTVPSVKEERFSTTITNGIPAGTSEDVAIAKVKEWSGSCKRVAVFEVKRSADELVVFDSELIPGRRRTVRANDPEFDALLKARSLTACAKSFIRPLSPAEKQMVNMYFDADEKFIGVFRRQTTQY